jgi:molybdopterin-binding protein
MTPVSRGLSFAAGKVRVGRCRLGAEKIRRAVFQIGAKKMKVSARNQLKGKITEVTKGATTSHVLIEIGSGVIITASITNEAVADLQLKKGDDAWAVIKASDVMIGK